MVGIISKPDEDNRTLLSTFALLCGGPRASIIGVINIVLEGMSCCNVNILRQEGGGMYMEIHHAVFPSLVSSYLRS